MHITFQKLNCATLKIMSLHFAAGQKKIFEKFNANFTHNFVIFDTETNCGGKKAEVVELAAICQNTGEKFTKLVLPNWDINEHASRVN